MKKLPVIMVGLAFVIVSCAPVAATIPPTETLTPTDPPTVPAQTQEPTATTQVQEPPAITESQQPSATGTSQSPSEDDVTAPSPGGRRNFQPQLETISINMNEVVTLLPPDAIPAVLPERAQDIMVSAAQADNAGIDQSVQVIGVEISGESRAYPIPFLSRHEIVNDEVGGRKIAATW
jgi:hypothetical protein